MLKSPLYQNHSRFETQNFESPEVLLEKALEIALPDRPVKRIIPQETKERRITRRGILWIGQTCNLRCHFCYYLDRIEDKNHPEHAFMSLEKVKQICKTLVDVYGNNSVDIQGGEPTLWKPIYDLVRYCNEIGLAPTIITNAQVLDNMERVLQFKEAGLRDFIVSVQGLGPVYDVIVQKPGAHVKQMEALRNIQEAEIPFRINCVMSRAVVPQLPQIAELGVRTGAFVVNFLAFNPFDDQRTGKRSAENVPTYREIGDSLNQALDTLEKAKVEGNVRYFPICMVAERHRKSVYNFQQLPYDVHENDFASWSWTGQQPQRTKLGATTPPPQFGPRVRLSVLRDPLRQLGKIPKVGRKLRHLKDRLDSWSSAMMNAVASQKCLEDKYREESKLRAEEHCGYTHGKACSTCDAREICDGFHGDYAKVFGMEEARSIQLGKKVNEPQFFIKDQDKALLDEDMKWVLGVGEKA